MFTLIYKLLQLIKNKFINKKEIADIKITTEPERNGNLEPINGTRGNASTIRIAANSAGCYGSGGSSGGGGGSGIPFCGTCGIQCSINYVLKCNC